MACVLNRFSGGSLVTLSAFISPFISPSQHHIDRKLCECAQLNVLNQSTWSNINYISVFAKTQFFHFGNIMFFCRFVFLDFFLFFFLPPTFLSRRSTDSHQIWHEGVFLHAIYTDGRALRKVQKPCHDGQKT